MSETDETNKMNKTNGSSDALLDQADALMRRRNFSSGLNLAEAKSAPVADAPTEEAHAFDSPDIPVLTEVIETGEMSHPATTLDENAEAMRQARQQEICKALESWLEEVLPQTLANSMDGLREHLLTELRERARIELPARLGLSESE